MSTRKRKANDIAIASSTEYQLHKSQLFPTIIARNLVDFTTIKLMSCINNSENEDDKIVLKKVLQDYKKGKIAVAWKAGLPIWINVTNELNC